MSDVYYYDEIESRTEAAAKLSDFETGFAAALRGDAKTRAVFGSPEYHKGYAYGVQTITRRRHLQVLDDFAAERGRRLGRMLRSAVIGALLGLALGFVLVQSARADTIDDWRALNETCQGGSGAAADKACKQRGHAASKLRASGWFEGAHGVWVSPAHVAAFVRITRHYDEVARANPGMLESIMTAQIDDLRRAVPDEAIFAMWNGGAGSVVRHAPYSAALLAVALPYLERTLSGRNDPRFRMDAAQAGRN